VVWLQEDEEISFGVKCMIIVKRFKLSLDLCTHSRDILGFINCVSQFFDAITKYLRKTTERREGLC
jgi:hypothetical protein